MYEYGTFPAKIFRQAPVFVANECWIRIGSIQLLAIPLLIVQDSLNCHDYFSLKWLLDKYLLRHQVKNTEVGKVLKQELFPYRYPHTHHMSEKFWYRHRRMKQLVKLLGQRTLPVKKRPFMHHRPRKENRSAIR